MKKLLLCVLAVLMTASVAVGSEPWIRTYGSGLENQGHDVLLLEDGGYLVVADTVTQYEPVMIGHLLLMRLDADGEVLWERTYGGDRSCTGQSILAAEDGGYVIAGTIETEPGSDLDVYLLRVAEDGTELWSRSFGTPLDEVGGRLLETADGGYVVVGNSVDRDDVVADPGAPGYAGFAGRSNAYVVRTDAEGNEIWSRRYGTEDNVIASGGAIADDGGIVVLTYVLYYPIDDNDVRLFKIDAAGVELWSRTWEEGKASGYDMIATSDGGYLISGARSYPDDPERAKADALLIKVDGDGCELWTATYGEADQVETAHAVTETSDGQYVSVGSQLPDLYTYGDDIYLVGLDVDGALLWERVTPTVKHNMYEGFVQHPDGSFVIVGSAARPGQSFRIQLIKTTPPESTMGTIAFDSDRDGNVEIYAASSDGSGVTRLTDRAGDDLAPAWSPDGSSIAFSTATHSYVMELDTGELRQLPRSGQLNWSPDGTRLVYVSFPDGDAEIFVMDADGGNARQLTHNDCGDFEPVWLPDGDHIGWSSQLHGNADIFVMDAEGGSLERLTDDEAHDAYPHWSPDGSRVVFCSDRAGNWEIYAMNADGTDVERLTFTDAFNGAPKWSPDGTRIAFESNRDGDSEIYVMNADGSDVRKLTDNDAEDRRPSWRP
jgi:hypothetical protein